ncbi:MAG: HIT family protein [Rhodospirillaceae bacterium]|nr:HIT family protein [Rhodospirillaceae bacterium]
MPRPCIFCAIVAGEVAAAVVLERAEAVAFLDHRPLLKGHCLLVPRAHVETFDDLSPDLIAPLFAAAQRLSRAVQAALSADGSFLAVNTRISQSVPHLHVHVVPRWRKDGLFSKSLLWMRRPYRDEAEMAAVQEAIRAALARAAGEA